MPRTSYPKRRQIAETIWHAAVSAVNSRHLMTQAIRLDAHHLQIGQSNIPLDSLGRLIVVGGGKAGFGMVQGLEKALPEEFLRQRVVGWVNVPEDCLDPAHPTLITCHAARPPGINEPFPQGVAGTEEILKLVRKAAPEDVVLVLISGGGSALLPAPRKGITLEQKRDLINQLARKGANIVELNSVRKELSEIKGGGLARNCRARRLISLIISDVIGDPLEVIASGPTVLQTRNPQRALAILRKYLSDHIPREILNCLNTPADDHSAPLETQVEISNQILGSNRIALAAAAARARELGCEVIIAGSDFSGPADEFAQKFLQRSSAETEQSLFSHPQCILAGGETTVDLSNTDQPGLGGRNQEVALAAACEMSLDPVRWKDTLMLAAGTDGEDGPTDAAGGFADQHTVDMARQNGIPLQEYLQRHNSYPALKACDSLFQTGPTHTNVMDLAILLQFPGHS